jgi:hypothetical protein
MAELITLEGKGQEKGKKVTGYKFPDNLDDLKFPFKMLFQPNYAIGLKESITSVKNVDVPSRQVIFVKREKTSSGDKLLTKEGYSLGVSKGSFNKGSVVISPEQINLDSTTITPVKPIKPSKTPTSNATIEKDVNNTDLGKTARKIQVGFAVVGWGVFGLLAYKFWNKSNNWKIILSIFGAYNLYNTYKTFSKPALQLSGGSNSNTGTETGKITENTTNTSNTNLTKAQKIDLIIKNMNSRQGAESSPEDEQNTRAFLSLRQPVQLDRWVKISKALNDSEINSAMEINQQQGFALLKSKYGLAQQDIEKDMQDLMEFLSGSVESAISNSAFSNFESSLNLDL